ncbi:arylsulfatase B-like [Rhipicephalus sanguineus]|uniref:arylsulfatase B-like n=1 Tax=Rhipicephalus sanguineus TaxID=34632 RepID=UPI0020C1BF7E|nr:arylsulfatase B-like [Rhipicephalus sanguineus]
MTVTLILFLMATASPADSTSKKPNIIFILADDLGWADVSFHGSSQIPTPNLDALAADGVVLNAHYAQSVCAPSRAALLSGLYPLRFGIQQSMLYPSAPGGLPADITLLPQHLGKLGYESHIVGKWHLGCSKQNQMPTRRGFSTHFGFLNHGQDYITHTVTYNGSCGYDFWLNEQPLTDALGIYSMDLFLDRANSIITHHDTSKPLFLFLSMQAPHIGRAERMFPAPEANIAKFAYIGNANRTGYAATVDTLDEATGTVVEALHGRSMLGESVIVFCSDNGAERMGMGSNWPLRGTKKSLWEGGVRVPAFIWSPLLRDREERVSEDIMHLVDWMPTLYQVAGGKVEDVGTIDGVSQWDALMSRDRPPVRQELLHGFDPADGSGAYRSGRYKLVVIPSDGSWEDTRLEPVGDTPSDVDVSKLAAESKVAKVLAEFHAPSTAKAANLEWRRLTSVSCGSDHRSNFEAVPSPYLFDIFDDPCELRNLAQERSHIVDIMMQKLAAASDISAPSPKESPDPEAYPLHNNCTWGPRRNSVCSSDLCMAKKNAASGPLCGTFPSLFLFSLCLAYVSQSFESEFK